MDADRTLYVRNITPDITENLLYELFLQAGPLEDVTVKGNIAFIRFEDEDSVLYACSLFEGLKLYGNEIVVKPRAGSKFASARIRSIPPFNDYSIRPLDAIAQAPQLYGSFDSLPNSIPSSPQAPSFNYNHSMTSVLSNSRNFRSPFPGLTSSASYPSMSPNWTPQRMSYTMLPPHRPPGAAYGSGDRNNRSDYSERSYSSRGSITHDNSASRERSPFNYGYDSRSSPRNSYQSSHTPHHRHEQHTTPNFRDRVHNRNNHNRW